MNLWSQVNKKECLSLAQRSMNTASGKKISTNTVSSPFAQRLRKK